VVNGIYETASGCPASGNPQAARGKRATKVLSIAGTKLVTPRSGGVTPKSTCRCTLLTMADPVRWDDTKSTDSLHIPKLGCVAVSTMPTQLESDMSG